MFAGILALWHLKGFTQLFILSVTSACMLAFVAAFKPFKVRVRNQLAIINETTIVVALMTMFPFVFPEISDDHFRKAAKVAGTFILTLILINKI